MAIAQANDGLYGDDTETPSLSLSVSWNGEWARKREQERGKSDRIEKHSFGHDGFRRATVIKPAHWPLLQPILSGC